ncbi:MAG: hypothetical protein J5I90_13600 [Caldilineales bacterium]|nr:hypothetical protein [Caldilineales bacterium]
MPSITRTYIKTSLLYLIATLIVAILLSLCAMSSLPAVVGYMTPVYYHLLMVGWITQLIFGVIFWMFPKQSKERPRGSETLAWAVYALLNLGLILRVIAEPMVTTRPSSFWGIVLLVSALSLWLAGVLFVANTWRRVKER